MNAETVAVLNRINRRFYSRCADAFSETRSQPWPGWSRAVPDHHDGWPNRSEQCDALTILDVGCGNARFADFLRSRLAGTICYFGIDDSSEMLEMAERRLAALPSVQFQLEQRDLVDDSLTGYSGDSKFHLIVVFGVLHHIPGFDRRQQLLQELADALEMGGLLLLSFWQFGELERFQRRFLEWPEHNLAGDEVIDLDQLEAGDHLLAWGTEPASARDGEGRVGPRRYCHHATEDESRRLVNCLGLSTREIFRSDGRTGDLNLYYVLEKPGGRILE